MQWTADWYDVSSCQSAALPRRHSTANHSRKQPYSNCRQGTVAFLYHLPYFAKVIASLIASLSIKRRRGTDYYSQYAQFSKPCKVASSDDRQVVALQISTDYNMYKVTQQYTAQDRRSSTQTSVINSQHRRRACAVFYATAHVDTDSTQMPRDGTVNDLVWN